MVNRILPRASPETVEVFEKRGDAAMAHMLRALPTLPILPGDDHKYSEETVLTYSIYVCRLTAAANSKCLYVSSLCAAVRTSNVSLFCVF